MSENTITIDESTGLPKLPEGLYWEVVKVQLGDNNPSQSQPVRWTPLIVSEAECTGYFLRLCQRTVGETVYKERRRNPEAGWWNRKPRFLPPLPPTPVEGFRVLECQFVAMLEGTLTKEKILGTAEWIMRDIEREQKKAEAEERLLGKYPPNKLG